MSTLSGIVTLCKLPYRALIESALNQCTVWQLTEYDKNRYVVLYTYNSRSS